MNKNDYRRALIMLRNLAGSYAGHVRLERRTLLATMQFTVTGAQDGDALVGVMIGQKGKSWYAVNLGALSPMGGERWGLLCKFDPRNIERRDLESHQLVGVASPTKGLVLSGFLNGSVPVDYVRAAEVVRRLIGGDEPDAAEAAAVVAEAAREMIDEGCTCEVTEDGADCVCPPPETESVAPLEPAIDLIPPEAEWPEAASSVRELFEQNAPIDEPPVPQFVFVRATLGDPEEGEHCLIGLKTLDGTVSQLCYAVPGTYANEPPPGLSGYTWCGEQQNGYWIALINLITGEPVEAE